MAVYEVSFDGVRKSSDLRHPFDFSPLDISGATFTWTITDCSGTIKTTKTLGDGLSRSGTQLDVAILKAELADWGVGEYDHELVMLEGDATSTLFYGKLSLIEGTPS